jgi:hypothetical protein
MRVPRISKHACYPYTTTVSSRDGEEETAFGQQSTRIFSEAICTEEIAIQYDTVCRSLMIHMYGQKTQFDKTSKILNIVEVLHARIPEDYSNCWSSHDIAVLKCSFLQSKGIFP